jgi:alkylation response protein AidB-like acyl-CoA dehydrogenase
VRAGPFDDLEWVTPEQAEFFRSVVSFSRSLDREGVSDRDRRSEFPWEAWKRCGEFGIHGLPAPEEFGGSGADVVTTMLALEALGYGCSDNGLVFSINAHMWTSVIPLWHHGTDEQRRRWLSGLCSGELVGCHAITEPDAGSDPFAMTTSARKTGEGYVLNGRKTFITNAPIANLLVIFARTAEGSGPFGITAFLLEQGTPGCATSGEIEKMGLRTSPMSEVVLDDCRVPESAILGRLGRGADIFQTSMMWERACIMASQVGLMRRTMEACIAHARQRRQFGQPIGRFESVAEKIANMKIAVDAARALVIRVGRLMDGGRDASLEAAVAKTFVSEANVRTHLDAVQIHGGYGYMTEFELERALRDAVGSTIYSGTSEIQRRIIARYLGL